MPKNRLFFRKTVKTTEALEAPHPNPRWPPAVGAPPQTPSYCIGVLLLLQKLKAFVGGTRNILPTTVVTLLVYDVIFAPPP